MHVPLRHRSNHRFGIGGLVLWRKHRLVETGNNHVDFIQHRTGTVDIALPIFDVGLDAAQDAHAVHQARPHVHVHKVPIMRCIGHIRAMVGDGEKFDALLPGFDDVIMQRAVGVGAGDGVHM
ncbi:hypothetical protein D3C78_1419050 [compost metagenome]